MEEWKNAYEPFGTYRVSNRGRIMTPSGKIATLTLPKRRRNISINAMRSDTKRHANLTLRLAVAIAFIEGFDKDKHGLRYKDGNPHNCSVDNLATFIIGEEVEDTSLPTKSMLIDDIRNLMSRESIHKKYGISSTALHNLYRCYDLLDAEATIRNQAELDYLTDDSEEQWRDHPKHSLILVSNHGRIRSKRSGSILTVVTHNARSVLVPTDYVTGKRITRKIDTLVAETWLDNPNNYSFIRHKDGDRTNCRVSNLAWIRSIDINPRCMYKGYVAEAPEFVQYYLKNLGQLNKVELSSKFGINISTFYWWMRKLGFSASDTKLKELKEFHTLNNTLDLFYSARCNITYLDLEEGEVLKYLDDYPGYYITSYGRVISHKKFTKMVEMKQTVVPGVTPFIRLSSNDKKTISTRTLVARAFVPNKDPDSLTHVIAKDGNNHNCRADNLEWVTAERFNSAVVASRLASSK